jgi:hypothetical protein
MGTDPAEAVSGLSLQIKILEMRQASLSRTPQP